MRKGDWKSTVIFYLVLIAIWLGFSLSLIGSAFSAPSKLSMSYGDTEILIADEAGVLTLDEQEEISRTFQEFQEETGITPAFLTTFDDIWDTNYTSLENYAYDVYVNWFEDESHWLLVYSEPRNADSSFVDWKWEGMQGDDTDDIITDSLADRQTAAFQKYLTKESYSVGESVVQSFRDILPGIMEGEKGGSLFCFFIGVLPPCIFLVIRILMTISRRGREKAVQCATDQGPLPEDKCDYCGGIYVHGLHESCPHCGAPIQKAQNDAVLH